MKREKPMGLTNAQQIATLLHGRLCHSNHTDGCGWFYHENNWEAYEQNKWLKKANALLEIVDFDTAVKITLALL